MSSPVPTTTRTRPPLATSWPMLTFEKFVYTVLVRIAMEDENFLELTEAQVREVLYRVGYLEIEPGYEGVVA